VPCPFPVFLFYPLKRTEPPLCPPSTLRRVSADVLLHPRASFPTPYFPLSLLFWRGDLCAILCPIVRYGTSGGGTGCRLYPSSIQLSIFLSDVSGNFEYLPPLNAAPRPACEAAFSSPREGCLLRRAGKYPLLPRLSGLLNRGMGLLCRSPFQKKVMVVALRLFCFFIQSLEPVSSYCDFSANEIFLSPSCIQERLP